MKFDPAVFLCKMFTYFLLKFPLTNQASTNKKPVSRREIKSLGERASHNIPVEMPVVV